MVDVELTMTAGNGEYLGAFLPSGLGTPKVRDIL
jgi:hypothetical protein